MIDPLMKCWIVDDILLLDNDFVGLVVYLVFRLTTPVISYMSTLHFDTGFIGLEVPDLAQPVIKSGSQTYKGY